MNENYGDTRPCPKGSIDANTVSEAMRKLAIDPDKPDPVTL
jgi:hypothetical protein